MTVSGRDPHDVLLARLEASWQSLWRQRWGEQLATHLAEHRAEVTRDMQLNVQATQTVEIPAELARIHVDLVIDTLRTVPDRQRIRDAIELERQSVHHARVEAGLTMLQRQQRVLWAWARTLWGEASHATQAPEAVLNGLLDFADCYVDVLSALYRLEFHAQRRLEVPSFSKRSLPARLLSAERLPRRVVQQHLPFLRLPSWRVLLACIRADSLSEQDLAELSSLLPDMGLQRVEVLSAAAYVLLFIEVDGTPDAEMMALEQWALLTGAAVGLGRVVDDLDDIALACKDASTAAGYAERGSVVGLTDVPQLHRSATAFKEQLRAAMTPTVRALVGESFFAPTITEFCRYNMSIGKTARQLGVHVNTIYARFARIRQLTDLDPRNVEDLLELRIAAILSVD